jgi:hypothetical protein
MILLAPITHTSVLPNTGLSTTLLGLYYITPLFCLIFHSQKRINEALRIIFLVEKHYRRHLTNLKALKQIQLRGMYVLN